MSPRDEEVIERYIRFPDTLSAEDRERASELLRSDPTARRLAAFYRGYYDELDALDEDRADTPDGDAD